MVEQDRSEGPQASLDLIVLKSLLSEVYKDHRDREYKENATIATHHLLILLKDKGGAYCDSEISEDGVMHWYITPLGIKAINTSSNVRQLAQGLTVSAYELTSAQLSKIKEALEPKEDN